MLWCGVGCRCPARRGQLALSVNVSGRVGRSREVDSHRHVERMEYPCLRIIRVCTSAYELREDDWIDESAVEHGSPACFSCVELLGRGGGGECYSEVGGIGRFVPCPRHGCFVKQMLEAFPVAPHLASEPFVAVVFVEVINHDVDGLLASLLGFAQFENVLLDLTVVSGVVEVSELTVFLSEVIKFSVDTLLVISSSAVHYSVSHDVHSVSLHDWADGLSTLSSIGVHVGWRGLSRVFADLDGEIHEVLAVEESIVVFG